MTHEDICHCFKGDTLLAIQAPSGTQLEVPIPDGVSDKNKRIIADAVVCRPFDQIIQSI